MYLSLGMRLNRKKTIAGVHLVVTAAPALEGSFEIGNTVSGTDAVISHGTLTSRQWYRDGAIIDGASELTYVLAPEDDQSLLSFANTIEYDGQVETVFSDAALVAFPAPVFDAQPALSLAAPTVGDVLTLDHGAASPSAQLEIDMFTLDGADMTGTLNGLEWDSSAGWAGTIEFRTRATNSGGVTLSDTITLSLAEALPAAPSLTGGLANQSLTENSGVVTVDAAVAFAGPDLSFALVDPVSSVSIDPVSGVVSIDTDTSGVLSAAPITVEASNAGGAVSTIFVLDVAMDLLVAPVAAGGLPDVTLVEGSGVQTVNAAIDFTNTTEGSWSVSGLGATIDGVGVVSLSTDSLRTDSSVVVTYTNAAGTAASGFNVTVEPETVASGDRVQDTEWMVIPSGDAGSAWLEVVGSGLSGVAPTALQYRFQPLDATPDMAKLNDPTGAWSAWADTSAVSGRMALGGLPTVPCAVQLRAMQDGEWSKPSRFKRVGNLHFDYSDTVATWAGATSETMPATVYWGTLNTATPVSSFGPILGRQRIPDDAAAITSGDALGHFEVITEAGRAYLRPTSVGIAAWTGGETYTLTLDDASGTTVSIEILADTAVITSEYHGLGTASLTEWEAFMYLNRNPGNLSGKTLLLRPGFYDTQASNGYFGVLRNLPGLDNATDTFTYASVDPAQPAMVSQVNILKSFAGNGHRDVIVKDLDLYLPMASAVHKKGSALTVDESQKLVNINDGTGSVVIERCRMRSDYIEGRYGFAPRGGAPFIEVYSFYANKAQGLNLQDNVIMYAMHPPHLIGCDGDGNGNLVTHVYADYLNIIASPDRDSTFRWNWNRHREHMGDQNRVHSDAMQSGYLSIGTFDGFEMRGNIFLKGFEGRACGGGFTVTIANYPQTISDGTFTAGADTYDHKYNILTESGTITLPANGTGTLDSGHTRDPNFPGYVFSAMNYSDGDVTIVGNGVDLTLKSMERIILHDDGANWQTVLAAKGFQGAPYQNDAGVTWKNSVYSHNIIIGISAASSATLNGFGPESLSNMRLHNNAWLPYVYDQTGTTHDLNGDGLFDERDGRFIGPTGPLVGDGIVVDGVAPVGLSIFKNVSGQQPLKSGGAGTGAAFVDAWDGIYLGRAELDTDANRTQYFGASAGSFGPEIQTFSQAIEAVRLKSGVPAADAKIGPVGPNDTDAGFADFDARVINAYPALVVTHTYPENHSADFPAGSDPVLWFEYPIAEGSGFSGITLREVGGSDISTTATINGRKLTLSATLTAGTTYELIIPSDGIVHYDDASTAFSGWAGGVFDFTASSSAYDNILSNRDSNYPGGDMAAYLDGEWHMLGETLRFDTIYLTDKTPHLPTGPAVWSVEVEKAAGTASLRLYHEGGTGGRTLEVNATSGAVTNSSGGISGTDFGVTDQGDCWRIWIAGNGSGMTRYFLELNKTLAPLNYRRPMLVDAPLAIAPWVSTNSKFVV